MTALNLCTSVFTGGESVLQYYLVCQTCSTADDRVAVCLNCAAICHDQHEKHSLTRGKIFCGCLQSTHSCSACSLDELAHALSSGDKRKRSRDGAASSRFLVWTQLDQDSKTVASSHLTAEEAGSSALLQFVENNPWKYASLDELRERGKVTETRDANGSLSLVATGEDGTQWRAGVDLLENTAAGSGGSGQKSAKRKRLRAEPGETSSLLSGGESSSASHAPTKRAKNAPNKPTGDGQSAAVAADAATGRDAHPDGQKNTPKRPLASFMLYLNTTREQVSIPPPFRCRPSLCMLFIRKPTVGPCISSNLTAFLCRDVGRLRCLRRILTSGCRTSVASSAPCGKA